MDNIEVSLKNAEVSELRLKGGRATFRIALPAGDVGGVLAEWKDLTTPGVTCDITIKGTLKKDEKVWKVPGDTKPGGSEKP